MAHQTAEVEALKARAGEAAQKRGENRRRVQELREMEKERDRTVLRARVATPRIQEEGAGEVGEEATRDEEKEQQGEDGKEEEAPPPASVVRVIKRRKKARQVEIQ